MAVDRLSPIPKAVAQEVYEEQIFPSTGDDYHNNDTQLESLCEQCQLVDWPNVPTWSNIETNVIRDFIGKSRTQLLNSGCRVCRLVGHLVNPKIPGNRPLTVSLDAEVTPPDLEKPLSFTKLIIRSPVAGPRMTRTSCDDEYSRFIIAHKFPNGEAVGIRTLEPSRANMSFFREKLKECLEEHEMCRSTGTEVTGLRVIDVGTKEVCQAPPRCEYTALSYVWGDESSCQSTQDMFPPVVQDAIIATKALGC